MTALLAWSIALFVSAALLSILVVAISNARRFPRLRMSPAGDAGTCAGAAGSSAAESAAGCAGETAARVASGVSGAVAPFTAAVLIPARNEAAVIGATVLSLLSQAPPGCEVIVLDDSSEDGTAAAARSAAGTNPNFRLLRGQPLPQGWMGKNWACHQLALATDADILVFADADVQWQPGALAAVLNAQKTLCADLLTVWPTQITKSWGERLTVPLMALAVLGYLPLGLAHDFYHPLAAAANGQCMVFRRGAYAAVGGHAAVRGVVVEDVRLAQRIKACRLRLRMADGNELLRCRMYNGWRAALDGYAKNILAGHGNSVALLALSTIFHWLLFIWPWAWLLFGSVWPPGFWPFWPAALVGAGIAARAVTAAATHQRVLDALLMPISVVLMTLIAARAIWWRWRFGGVIWKGRILRDA
jgi:chlorobactene glucosyltransferase